MTQPFRRMVIELTEKTSQALSRREENEELNPTTLFNRAMQIYDVLMTAQENGERIMLGDREYQLKVMREANCPSCHKPLWWSALYKEWACSDPNCINAHGPGVGGGWPVDLLKVEFDKDK